MACSRYDVGMTEAGTSEPIHDRAAEPASDTLADDKDSAEDQLKAAPVPANLGAKLDGDLREKLHKLLLRNPGQLGDVYRAIVKIPEATSTELLSLTNCANSGVVGNRRSVIWAIMNEGVPNSPSVARQAASTVRVMSKAAEDEAVKSHLGRVLTTLEDRAENPQAVAAETEQLESDSTELANALKQASGVYVYTYPHYWRHPYIAGSERRLLKVGRTTNQAWTRVISQARQTGMPEDPFLLRVYKTGEPTAVEGKFHMLLDAAEHQRSVGTAVGTEWFVTTIEYCDAVAEVLDLEVLKGSTEPA